MVCGQKPEHSLKNKSLLGKSRMPAHSDWFSANLPMKHFHTPAHTLAHTHAARASDDTKTAHHQERLVSGQN